MLAFARAVVANTSPRRYIISHNDCFLLPRVVRAGPHVPHVGRLRFSAKTEVRDGNAVEVGSFTASARRLHRSTFGLRGAMPRAVRALGSDFTNEATIEGNTGLPPLGLHHLPDRTARDKDHHHHPREAEPETARIIFPGGGMFFFWQAGAVCHLRERGYDLPSSSSSTSTSRTVILSGASAGAATAALAATGVDMVDATELALDIAGEMGLWRRRRGLQAVWSTLIERWLTELLPEDAADVVSDGRRCAMCNTKLAIVVTHVPSWRKRRISSFESKEDLIRCVLASAHLPWFLDGQWTSQFRGEAYIDGSLGCRARHHFPDDGAYHTNNGPTSIPTVSLDWKRDVAMLARVHEVVRLTSEDEIWSILNRGRSFAEGMERRGDFASFPRSGECADFSPS